MKTVARLLIVLCVGIAASTLAETDEVVYLVDTNDLNGNDGISVLYRVDIDEGSSSATITMLPNGTVNYNDVSGIAAEPDGSVIWMIDSGGSPPRTLAAYDVANATTFEVGKLSIGDSDNAALSPTGNLYTTTEAPGMLYAIDTVSAAVTLVGSLPEAGNGGGLVFAPDGTLYMLNNNGLFQLTLPAVTPGLVTAVKIGTAQDSQDYTGLALRANGVLIASHNSTDAIHELSVTDASVSKTYPMVDFDHGFGGMTTAPSVRCTRTIGYWKNHDWNEAVVYINGELIDETIGRGFSPGGEKPKNGILWNANGNTYSMLYAQLVAAKLNTNNAAGVAVIEAAEDFLIGKVFDAVVPMFEKPVYAGHVEELTLLNERYPCEDDEVPFPPGCN